jgi:hypothetical protein
MPSPLPFRRIVRFVRPSHVVALIAALPAVLVATPALADECGNDTDCGFGFACETVVTSTIGTGGAGGTGMGGAAGVGGAAGTGTAGAAFGGTGTGGAAGSAPAGSGGTGAAPRPAVCGNFFCEVPTESPATCPDDCVYTTLCSPAVCTEDAECAPGYTCPEPGSIGTGGGPNVAFCGDLICSASEDAPSCPFDCDPNYRRCAPGNRGCSSDRDCVAGYVCEFSGSGGIGPGGTGSAEFPGAARGGSTFTGGVGGTAGGSAGIAGTIAVGGTGTGGFVTGGSAGTGVGGVPGEGVCVPSGTGGTYGGTAGVGGAHYGGTAGTSPGGTSGAIAGSGGNGGDGGTNSSDDDGGTRVITDRGCSLANGGGHSSFAALLLGFAALLRAGRRRPAKHA